MRLSKIVGPFFFALALAAAAGCATEPGDEGTNETDNAITGSIVQARVNRVKQAYIDAKVEDFTEIQPLVDASGLAAWNIDASDPHWFSFNVDGRVVYVVDLVADSNAMLSGQAASPTNPHEAFVVVFDAGSDGALGAILVYRADADQWIGMARQVASTRPRSPSTDGGIPVSDGGSDGGGHDASADGGHADGGHSDGGASDGGHSDGGHTDGGVSDGGHADSSAHLDGGGPG